MVWVEGRERELEEPNAFLYFLIDRGNAARHAPRPCASHDIVWEAFWFELAAIFICWVVTESQHVSTPLLVFAGGARGTSKQAADSFLGAS